MTFRIQNIPALVIAIAIFFSCTDAKKGGNQLAEIDQVSYNFHIRPILSDKCFACHGPDANKREADLRLDVEEAAFAALKENPNKFAVVPGKPDESEVYHRIISEDP